MRGEIGVFLFLYPFMTRPIIAHPSLLFDPGHYVWPQVICCNIVFAASYIQERSAIKAGKKEAVMKPRVVYEK